MNRISSAFLFILFFAIDYYPLKNLMDMLLVHSTLMMKWDFPVRWIDKIGENHNQWCVLCLASKMDFT